METKNIKINNLVELYTLLPEKEKIIVDVLREIIRSNLPSRCREKISYNVPYFYGKRGICIIWPATIPRGGIKSGVLLGFWYGNKLNDTDKYLIHGTNKRIYYRIYQEPEDINEPAIVTLLNEAVSYDEAKR